MHVNKEKGNTPSGEEPGGEERQLYSVRLHSTPGHPGVGFHGQIGTELQYRKP